MPRAVVSAHETLPAKPGRRRLQWSVRGLLGLTTLCAVVLALVLAPRIRERATIDWLESKRAPFRIEPFGPQWLRKLIGDRYLHHVVSVDLRKCDITDADLTRLACLPRLRNIALRGSRVTVDGVERMSSRWRDAWVDVLPAHTMYQRTAFGSGCSLSESIVEFGIAARWRMAWADSRGLRADQLAVRRQLVHALERLADAADAAFEPVSPVERAMLEAAIAEARIELTSVAQSKAGIESARREAESAGEQLVQRLDEAVEAEIDPLVFDAARELVTRLLLRCQPTARNAANPAAVLAGEVRQWERLIRQIELRCRTDPPRDLPAKFVLPAKQILCQVDLALAQARLARACGDHVAEQHALHLAADDATVLRESASAFRPPPFLSLGLGPVIAHRRAADLEIALARAQRDAHAEQAARDRWAGFLAEQRRHIACDSMGALILSCYSIVLQYDQQGAAIFERSVSELAIARG